MQILTAQFLFQFYNALNTVSKTLQCSDTSMVIIPSIKRLCSRHFVKHTNRGELKKKEHSERKQRQ